MTKFRALMIAASLAIASLSAGAQSAPSVPVAASLNWLQFGNPNDAYWMIDNRWGAAGLSEGTASGQFEQGVGVSKTVGANGEVAFRMKWRWPQGTTEVKGYPAALYGRKPGYATSSALVDGRAVILPDGSVSGALTGGATPGTVFPTQLPLQSLKATASFVHNAAPTGQGQLTYDLWLQSNPKQDSGWGNASITHEIMIPIANWGGYGAHPNGRNPGWYDHTATISGRLWHVYTTKGADGCLRFNFGGLNGNYGRTGWKMIAFVPDQMPLAGEIDLAALINYLSTRRDACGQKLVEGNEYLVSSELGVEPVVGSGDITVFNHRVNSNVVPAPVPTPTTPTPTPSCTAPEWNTTTRYMAGDKVMRLGKMYVATALSNSVWNVNSAPEWTPTYWALTDCNAPTPAPTPACIVTDWVRYKPYPAGAIVRYQKKLYRAKYANPGYVPTVSTYYWAPHRC